MTIKINNISPLDSLTTSTPISLTPSLVLSPASSPTLNDVITPTLAGHIALVIIALYMIFYYEKTVIMKDFTSLKLYIKGIFWIEIIPISYITEVKKYIFK